MTDEPRGQVSLDQDLMQRLVEAKLAYDEVKKYYEDLREVVVKQARLVSDEKNVDLLDAHGERRFTVRRSVAARFEGRKFKAEFPDLYAQFCTVSAHDSLVAAGPVQDEVDGA